MVEFLENLFKLFLLFAIPSILILTVGFVILWSDKIGKKKKNKKKKDHVRLAPGTYTISSTAKPTLLPTDTQIIKINEGLEDIKNGNYAYKVITTPKKNKKPRKKK